MSNPGAPSDSDFKQASLKLNEGLKTCRAVVSGYRALLVSKQDEAVLGDKQFFGSFDGQDEISSGS